MVEGLRFSWDSVSGGNSKSAGRVVFLLLALRDDLLRVVAACERKAQSSAAIKSAAFKNYTCWIDYTVSFCLIGHH